MDTLETMHTHIRHHRIIYIFIMTMTEQTYKEIHIIKESSNVYSKQFAAKSLIMLKVFNFVAKQKFNIIHIKCENFTTISWVLCKIQLI